VRHERRDVDRVEPPDRRPGQDDVTQRFDDGVGAAYHRRYTVEIDGARLDAEQAMALI